MSRPMKPWPAHFSGISVRNFRGFKKAEGIRLAPLTFLVGPNSSGKSSLFDAILLLVQSRFAMRSFRGFAPTWIGGFVDLGSFEDAVFGHRNSLAIHIEVELSSNCFPREPRGYLSPQKKKHPFRVGFEIRSSGTDPVGRLNEIRMADVRTGEQARIRYPGPNRSSQEVLALGRKWRRDQFYYPGLAVELRKLVRQQGRSLAGLNAAWNRIVKFVESDGLSGLAAGTQRVSSGRSAPQRWYPITGTQPVPRYNAERRVFGDVSPALLGEAERLERFSKLRRHLRGDPRSGQALGTPSYMSPELVKGAALDGRSDIFSLGVVLYEMLAWTKPFAGENITTVIYQIVGEQPQAPTALNPTLPPGLDDVALKALAKDPAERYQNCAELVADLKGHAAGAPKQGAGAKAAVLAPAAAAGVPAVERTTLLQHGTQPVASPQGSGAAGRRPRKALLAAGATAVLLLATVGIWQMRRTAPPASSVPAEEVAAPQPQSPPESGATPSRPDAVTRTAPPSAPAVPRGTGRVSIHTRPKGARILVNGKATGYRSPVNIGLAPGRHRITVERSGYARETRNVVVRKDRMALIRFELKRIDRGRSRR